MAWCRSRVRSRLMYLFPLVNKFLKRPHKPQKIVKEGGQRPTLCPGCGHRAAFFSIKKALPKALYPGDIGCYTLGHQP